MFGGSSFMYNDHGEHGEERGAKEGGGEFCLSKISNAIYLVHDIPCTVHMKCTKVHSQHD